MRNGPYSVVACLRGACRGSIRVLVLIVVSVMIMFGIGPMCYDEYSRRCEEGGDGRNSSIPPMCVQQGVEQVRTERYICHRIKEVMDVLK